MDKKKSEFDKVFSAWDILVIAFGAMIGWGWVVSSGDWIQRGGVLGAMIGFALGGVMIFFVGLTYAELTAAMPQCGGEHVFSYKAMGPIGSFICTWAIVLGYVSVVCFEACALPTIITYIYPEYFLPESDLQILMYPSDHSLRNDPSLPDVFLLLCTVLHHTEFRLYRFRF